MLALQFWWALPAAWVTTGYFDTATSLALNFRLRKEINASLLSLTVRSKTLREDG